MASRIAPGQNPTGGDHNSHGNDSFSPDKRVLIRFCQQRQQLTHFFSLFTYKCIGTCRALNTNNYIVFELFTYACHLMHASYTKRRKKTTVARSAGMWGHACLCHWQRSAAGSEDGNPAHCSRNQSIAMPSFDGFTTPLSSCVWNEALQHAKDHVHTWGMALPWHLLSRTTSLETDPCDV